jgi:hypothetical protein
VSIHFKITRQLLGEIRRDLARPHAFAHERVGFLSASISSADNELWILTRAYRPVADEDYLPSTTVGAMMGPDAIRKAMQWALDESIALFHLHTHGGRGRPGFSGTDVREQAKFVPTFFQTARKRPHGAPVLSDTSATGNIWLAPDKPGEPIDYFCEVGNPLLRWSGA